METLTPKTHEIMWQYLTRPPEERTGTEHERVNIRKFTNVNGPQARTANERDVNYGNSSIQAGPTNDQPENLS